MLRGYCSSLEAYYKRSMKKSAKEGEPRQSPDKWERAISSAHQALEMFRDAETKRQIQLIDVPRLDARMPASSGWTKSIIDTWRLNFGLAWPSNECSI